MTTLTDDEMVEEEIKLTASEGWWRVIWTGRMIRCETVQRAVGQSRGAALTGTDPKASSQRYTNTNSLSRSLSRSVFCQNDQIYELSARQHHHSVLITCLWKLTDIDVNKL